MNALVLPAKYRVNLNGILSRNDRSSAFRSTPISERPTSLFFKGGLYFLGNDVTHSSDFATETVAEIRSAWAERLVPSSQPSWPAFFTSAD